MDRKLIDDLLTELLRMPAQQRTAEKILANLTLAATAAGVSLTTSAAPLQLEHLQLASAMDRLAADLGSQYQARAMLRLGAGIEGVELCGVIEPVASTSPLPRFVAFGATARSVLAGVERDIRNSNQPPTKPSKARKAGTLTLSSLKQHIAKADAA